MDSWRRKIADRNVVSSLVELAQVVRQPHQIIGVGVKALALLDEIHPVLDSLENQVGAGCGAKADAIAVAVAQRAGRHVGAVAGIRIGRTIAHHVVTKEGVWPRPGLHLRYTAVGDIDVVDIGIALAQARIRNGDGLAGAGIAARIGGSQEVAADNSAGIFVEGLAVQEILDPGDIQHTGHGVHLGRIGKHHHDIAVGGHDLRAGRLDIGDGCVSVSAGFNARSVELLAVAGKPGTDLISRVEKPHPGHAVGALELARLAGCHAHLEGIVREIAQHIGAAGRQRIVR